MEFNARSRLAVKPSLTGRPYPAISESPNNSTRFSAALLVDGSNRISAAIALKNTAKMPYRGQIIFIISQPGIFMSNAAINLKDVSLTLGREMNSVNVLRGVNLEIGVGETASLIGPSGSGKSSLLLVAAGLETVTSGLVSVGGVNLSTLNEDDRARFRRQRIGFVFQAFNLIPSMTALENVAIPLELSGQRDARDLAAQELEAVGLSARSNHLPSELSGGEQQRVAIARAFVGNADILLADEPTGNLDRDTGEAVINLMFSRAEERSAALLLVTHDLSLAGRCARNYQMLDGQVLGI
jgi:putative ABC transport system ATP-binding protein